MDIDFGDEEEELGRDGDGEGEGDSRSHRPTDKECVLFVVDARAPMHVPRVDAEGQPTSETPFTDALSCVVACMNERILKSDTDLIGLVLYGTAKAKTPEGIMPFPHTYVMIAPDLPSATEIRELQAVRDERRFDEFGQIDDASSSDFSNVLWLVLLLFSGCAAAKGARKRLFLITNDPKPCGSSEEVRARVLGRCSDLRNGGVELQPFFVSNSPSHTDELRAAVDWHLILQVRPVDADAEDDDLDPAGVSVASCICDSERALFKRMQRTQHRKRSYGSVELSISDSHVLSLKMVTLVKPFVKPSATKLHAATNEPLTRERTVLCKVHGSVLQESDIFKAWEFGGSMVYFEPYELKHLKSDIGEDGLRLLGFKPAERLKPYHNLRAATFLEPSELRPGSTTAVEALVTAMVRRDRMAICSLRRGSSLRMAALLPQPRQLDADGVSMACGLHLVYLPWADELRSPELPPPLAEDDHSAEQLDATRVVCSALTLPEQTPLLGGVNNPAAHRHFAVTQAVVLGTEAEITVDGTLPDAAWFAEAHPAVSRFLGAFEVAAAATTSTGSSHDRPAKRARAEVQVPTSDSEWISLYASAKEAGLASLTAPKLKEYCKAFSLGVSGKKDDLVTRVAQHLSERATGAGAEAGEPSAEP